MQILLGESHRWAQAASLLSELAEQDESAEHALASLIQDDPSCAEAVKELRQQWSRAFRDEIEPLRGFKLWFPRRIADYQILRPLSQTAEETVCLARHLSSGRLLGIKLLAPGSGASANQLSESVESIVDRGRDQGIAYLSFSFTAQPTIASTRELIDAAKEPAPSLPSRTVAPKPLSPSAVPKKPFREAIAFLGHRVRLLWKRPSLHRVFAAIFVTSLGAVLASSPSLPRDLNSSSKTTDSVRKVPSLAAQTPDLAALDARLVTDPQDAEARALRAVFLAKSRSKNAWDDYEALVQFHPRSFACGFLESYLESKIGPKPRAIPSVEESGRAQNPQTVLDFALIGWTRHEMGESSAKSASFTSRH